MLSESNITQYWYKLVFDLNWIEVNFALNCIKKNPTNYCDYDTNIYRRGTGELKDRINILHAACIALKVIVR